MIACFLVVIIVIFVGVMRWPGVTVPVGMLIPIMFMRVRVKHMIGADKELHSPDVSAKTRCENDARDNNQSERQPAHGPHYIGNSPFGQEISAFWKGLHPNLGGTDKDSRLRKAPWDPSTCAERDANRDARPPGQAMQVCATGEWIVGGKQTQIGHSFSDSGEIS